MYNDITLRLPAHSTGRQNTKYTHNTCLPQSTSLNLNVLSLTITALIVLALVITSDVAAQTPANITASGLNTTITHNGNVYDISGGTRPGNGTHVYYSFGDFNLTAVESARFSNVTPHLPTTDLLGRVTGGNPSSIFGTIDTLAFPGANLFLMNPAGIIFGPSAQLNVGGSVIFTTANYLRLTDGTLFYSTQNTHHDALLSTAAVQAFGFLTSAANSISVKGSSLSVPGKHSIVLAGGSVDIQGEFQGNTLQPAKLAAPGGAIKIASIASRSEVDYQNVASVTNLDNTLLSDRASVILGPNSLVDFRHGDTGHIAIRGGQLTLEIRDSLLETRVSGSPTITTNRVVLDEGSSIVASSSSDTRSITISTDELELKNGAAIMSLNDVADGGPVSIHATNRILVTGTSSDESANPSSLESSTLEDRVGSSITVTAPSATIVLENNGRIQTNALGNNGKAGDISLHLKDTGHLTVTSGGLLTTSGNDAAPSGNISIHARSIEISNQPDPSQGGIQNSNDGAAGTGTITIDTDTLRMSNGARLVNESSGPSGDNASENKVFLKATGSIVLDNDSAIRVRNFSSDIDALTLNAQALSLSDRSTISATTFTAGSGGTIHVTAANVTLSGGSQLTTSSSQGVGKAGDIVLIGIRNLLLTGSGLDQSGHVVPTGIFSSTTAAGTNPNATGEGGKIDISAQTINVANGARIDTSTNDFALGAGGDITLTASQSVTISDGASISASSASSGNAGNIAINAGQQLDVLNGSITTQAANASGGNIDVRAIDRIRLVNSTISTSVLGAEGNGGNVFIDPKVVLLEGSTVTAKAVGGSGGNITITTPLYLKDSTSIVNASSQFGLNGTVTIQSPTSNLSGTIGQLASKMSPPQVLLQNRCVALAGGGGQSTFILSGRDTLPAEPGGWLSTPVLVDHWTGEDSAHASGLMVQQINRNRLPGMITQSQNPAVLSLRHLTPPGFLVRSFGIESTDCRS